MYHMYLIIVLRRCAIDEASIKSSSFTSLEAMQIAAEKVEVGTMKHLMNPKIVPIDKTMKISTQIIESAMNEDFKSRKKLSKT